MTNKLIFTVNNANIISKLQSEGINAFLFPLKDYSVGFPNTFNIDEIKVDNAYIFINRILTSKDINALKEVLNNLPNNIKGIFFDDLGVYQVIKDLDVQKILFSNHFSTNYESVNEMLEFMDSLVLSTDITEEEIDEILANAKKNLVLYTFGYVNIMYSRRNLLTNYQKHYNLDKYNETNLSEVITKKEFKVFENTYGTVFYNNEIFNALRLLNKKNTLFNLINTVFLSDEEVLNLVKSIKNEENLGIPSGPGFLDTYTIYKVKGGEK